MLFFLITLILIVAFIVIGLRMNEVNWDHLWVNILDGWIRFFAHRYHRLHGDKIDLPESGGILLISNHLSGLDPLLLIAASKRPLRFLIAEEEYNRFGLTWMFRAAGCIPVDRGGRTDAAFRAAVRALKSGEVVALFPHGRIHPDHEGEARVKPGALRLATLAQAPIFTARLTGVAGVGEVVASIFKRSHAHIKGMEIIEWQDAHGADLRQQVGELLLGRRAALEIQKS